MSEISSGGQIDIENQPIKPEVESVPGNRYLKFMRSETGRRVLRVLAPILLSLSISESRAEGGQESGSEAMQARATASLAERFTGQSAKSVTVEGVEYKQADLPVESLQTNMEECLAENNENLEAVGTPDHLERVERDLDKVANSLVKEDALDEETIDKIISNLKSQSSSMMAESIDHHRSVQEAIDETTQLAQTALDQINNSDKSKDRRIIHVRQDFQQMMFDAAAGIAHTTETAKVYRRLENDLNEQLEARMGTRLKKLGFNSILQAINHFAVNIDDQTTLQMLQTIPSKETLNPFIMTLERFYRQNKITEQQFSTLARYSHAEYTIGVMDTTLDPNKSGIDREVGRLLYTAYTLMEIGAVLNNVKYISDGRTLLLPRFYVSSTDQPNKSGRVRWYFQPMVSLEGKDVRREGLKKLKISTVGGLVGAETRF